MKTVAVLGVLFFAVWFLPSTSRATGIAECSDTELLAYSPSAESVASHRPFTLPIIDYPYGTVKDEWGFDLILRIDPAGRVTCYAMKGIFGRDTAMDGHRRALIERMAASRYTPFTAGGKPVPAIISENIYEQELPSKHLPLPKVPLSDVHITLERTPCLGTCPYYKVDVYGNGKVVYNGKQFTDVSGEHTYQVPVQRVAKLVESLDVKDIWSFRGEYRTQVTDNPTYILTISMGDQTHRLEDYVGGLAGMPRVVTDFEREVDQVAESDTWIHLQQPAVERLQAEDFRFDSPEGAQILACAVSNRQGHGEDAMLSLIKLGAPITGTECMESRFGGKPVPLIESALQNHRVLLIEPLIKRGALNTGGKPDQQKIDGAFRAAIRGGRLAPAKRIWNIKGDRSHPALTFEDVSEDRDHRSKQSPVTLLLSSYGYGDSAWEGLEVAQWLASKGCHLKAQAADGTTLLHIAASRNDARFVRYLLDQGLDPSKPGRYGLPALGSTQDEDVALMLLQAGTDLSPLQKGGSSFRSYAVSNHWGRVVAWLDEHDKS